MIAAVVPVRRGEHAPTVVKKLKEQGACVIVVRDRCAVELPGADYVIDKQSGTGFDAGAARDIGLDMAVKIGAEQVIMVDEDCIPQPDLVNAHLYALDRGCPVISCGRRLESGLGWKDPRQTGEAFNLHLFDGKGAVVQNNSIVKNCLATWTCNLGINRAAMDIVYRAMSSFTGEWRIFDKAFDGHWGGEDAFLGYVAWAYRVNMAFLPMGANAVKHMDHPRPEPEYGKGFKEVLEAQVTKFRKHLAMHPLSIDDIS